MRGPLAREDGIAMPTALMVLLICLILTALVATGADRLSASSGEDTRAKRALAAADAGVSVAIRRLRSLPDVADGQCVTTTGVAPSGGGACPSYTESLGDGASFTYHVTPATTAAGGCYEVPGTTVPADWRRRCITSTGTVGDVVRRVQAQVVAPPPGPGHWVGILGLDHVELRNSASLSACWSTEVPGPTIGSNISINVANKTVLNARCPNKVWGLQMPAGRSPSVHAGAEPQGAIPVTTAPAPFTIPPPPRDFESVETSNDNTRVATDATTSNATVNLTPGARSIDVGNSGSVRLHRGGDYSLCELSLANSASLDVSTTEKTRLFIDSPGRPGSSCPAGSAGLVVRNGARVNWPATVSDTDTAALTARSKNLEIYVYDADVTISNSARFAALLQAERSTVHYVNSSLTWGAVAAKRVVIDNSGDFQRPVGLAGTSTTGPPYRTAGWAQCRNVAPVAGDPQSGC